MPTKEDIVHDILAKKELSGIEHAFVEAILEKELKRNPKLEKQLDRISTRSGAYKELVKSVRAILRRNVSLYEGDPRHRDALLAELQQCSLSSQREEIITHLLATHASTNERLPFYDKVYRQIFAITGKPETVLDIGCGLNPLSYPDSDATYIGVDIDRNLCSAVDKYFGIAGIEGECKIVDVKGMEQIRKLPKSDVAFVFKLLELIEKGEGHKLSELLIKALPAKWVVASFPTMTSSEKPMRQPRRAWIELMLKRLNYEYKTFSIPNEIFYIIRKQ
jgi:16S rRNA (guanine(1405)-N(7))-methyltransferase